MAARNSAAAKRTELELVITRFLEAPAAVVFDMWSDPRHLAQWWGPKDFAATVHQWDFQPGGRWRTAIRSAQHGDYRMAGSFLEIVPAQRLVFTFRWDEPDALDTVITVTFAEQQGGTTLTFRQSPFPSESSRDSHADGWGECMDRLVFHARSVPVAAEGAR